MLPYKRDQMYNRRRSGISRKRRFGDFLHAEWRWIDLKRDSALLNIWLILWRRNSFGESGESVIVVVSPKNLVCLCFPLCNCVFIAVVSLHHTPRHYLQFKECVQCWDFGFVVGDFSWLPLFVCSATMGITANTTYTTSLLYFKSLCSCTNNVSVSDKWQNNNIPYEFFELHFLICPFSPVYWRQKCCNTTNNAPLHTFNCMHGKP